MQAENTVKEIFSTTEYEVFKTIKGNRPIKRSDVVRLINSIKARNLLSENPILVNQDFGVVDGQHRLAAATELKTPIFYMVSQNATGTDIGILNTVKKQWGTPDYLNYWAEQGSADYIAVRAFKEENPFFPLTGAIDLLSDNPENIPEKFRVGLFKVRADTTGANQTAKELTALRTFGDHAVTGVFIKAYLRAKSVEGFEFKRFVKQIEKQPLNFCRCVNIDGYLSLFEKFYNRDMSAANHVMLRGK